MTQTTNYQLNQWEATDQVKRTDFNADNAKIDAALAAKANADAVATAQTQVQAQLAGKADSAALAALQTVVNGKGNCTIRTGTYTGTGANSKTLTLGSSLPKLLIIAGGAHHAVFIPQSELSSCIGSTYSRSMSVTWTADGLSWSTTHGSSGSECLNEPGKAYCHFAFY